jgi:hypothetical protein
MGYHYVPQHYLRRFADPAAPKSIWLYDKKGGKARRVPILKVAQSRGFYTSDQERKLGQLIEGPANLVILKLLAQQSLTDDERLKLAFFIATMLKRVPYRRRKTYENIVPPVLQKTIADARTDLVRAAHANAADPLVLSYQLAQISAFEEKLKVELPDQIHDAVRSPWPTPKVVIALYDLAWRVVATDDSVHYLTSDNPAFFFEQFGVGKEESELTFPLSSSVCLHASKQGPKGGLTFLEAGQWFVDEMNHRVVSTTERTAFYHQNAGWVESLLTNGVPQLNRIQW